LSIDAPQDKGLSSGVSMLILSFVYLLEHQCSPLAWFIFWSIYAQPLVGLFSGVSMLNLSLSIDAPKYKPN
jgi:hypothetical protein